MSQSEADWILKAMIAMAAADGRLDAREVNTIQRVYQAQTGRAVDGRTVVLAVQTYARRNIFEDLSFAARSMSRETRETILRAAYLTAQPNEQLCATESETLKRVAAALGMSDDELQEIVAGAGEVEGSE